MPDPRFFTAAVPLTVASLIAEFGGRLVRGGDDTLIESVAPLSVADRGAIAFLGDRRHLAALQTTAAGVVIVPEALAEASPAPVVITSAEPQALWARVADRLFRPRPFGPAAGVDPTARLEPDVVVAPGASVGPDVMIGSGSRIGPNAVIGPGVAIGRDCWIGPNAVVGFALIGDEVRIAAGAVIGEPGFGAAPSAAGPVDIPQLGRVIIQDRVTVGANACIDRGAYDDTVIGEGTKLDNLVQIAHNVRIGRNCLIAASVGISGSTTVGDGVMFGGQAGVADHLTIGEGARIAGAAGVLTDVPAGETWSGYPARPLRRFLRESAWLAKQARTRVKGGDHD